MKPIKQEQQAIAGMRVTARQNDAGGPTAANRVAINAALTPERVRGMLRGYSQETWPWNGGDDLLAYAPSLAEAYLAATDRAEKAERERDEARAKIERYTKAVANVTAQEAWFFAACRRCEGTGICTPEARAAGENWSAAWDARAAAWEERDAAIKALCAEVRACPAELGPREASRADR